IASKNWSLALLSFQAKLIGVADLMRGNHHRTKSVSGPGIFLDEVASWTKIEFPDRQRNSRERSRAPSVKSPAMQILRQQVGLAKRQALCRTCTAKLRMQHVKRPTPRQVTPGTPMNKAAIHSATARKLLRGGSKRIR